MATARMRIVVLITRHIDIINSIAYHTAFHRTAVLNVAFMLTLKHRIGAKPLPLLSRYSRVLWLLVCYPRELHSMVNCLYAIGMRWLVIS
jgi:hypothetical protein